MQKWLKLASPFSRNDTKIELAGPRSRKSAKKSQVRSHGKASETRRSALMKKCQKITGLRSWKIAKKSQVRGHGKMSKRRRSAVTEKCQKVANPRSRKNAKKSQVRGHGKMLKSRRSVVTDKCQKLAGLLQYRSDARYKSNVFIASDECVYCWQWKHLSLKGNAFSNRKIHN